MPYMYICEPRVGMSGWSPGVHNGLIYTVNSLGVLEISATVICDQGGRVTIYERISPKAHMQPSFCIETRGI
jgi:hypothetical protein